MPDLHQQERKWLSLYSTNFVALADAAYEESRERLRAEAWAVRDAASDDNAMQEFSDGASDTDSEDVPPPMIHSLPSTVMRLIFTKLDAEAMSCCAQVCISWCSIVYEPSLWRYHCLRIWQRESPDATERLLWFGLPPAPYRTWRRMVTSRPRVRGNGIYVRRHHYAKSRRIGCNIDGSAAPPVSLVTYWRMMRFYNDGTVVSLVTPEGPDKAVRKIRRNWVPLPHESKQAYPNVGVYSFCEDTLSVELQLPVANRAYPDALDGTRHMALSVAGTHVGANNRFVTTIFAVAWSRFRVELFFHCVSAF